MSGLGPIDPSVLPAAVREAGPARRREYEAALGFERQLVQQLAKTLSSTAEPADDSATAATQAYRDMLPDQLADAVTRHGGLGLAPELDRALHLGGRTA